MTENTYDKPFRVVLASNGSFVMGFDTEVAARTSASFRNEEAEKGGLKGRYVVVAISPTA